MTKNAEQLEQLVDQFEAIPMKEMIANPAQMHENAALIRFMAMKEDYRLGTPLDEVLNFETWLRTHKQCMVEFPEDYPAGYQLTAPMINNMFEIHISAMAKFSQWFNAD